MYSLPSTSQIRDPSARSTKNGSPSTFRNARTGEFTPPGMRFCAARNNSDERECMRAEANVERPTLNVQRRISAVANAAVGKLTQSRSEEHTSELQSPCNL